MRKIKLGLVGISLFSLLQATIAFGNLGDVVKTVNLTVGTPIGSVNSVGFDGQFLYQLWGQIYKFDINGNLVGTFPWNALGGISDYAWDGQYMWVACPYNSTTGPNLIHKVDVSTWTIIKSINWPHYHPYGIAWDGNKLWVVGNDTIGVYTIDPNTEVISYKFPAPGRKPYGLAWDGQYLWMNDHRNDSGGVNQLDDLTYKIDSNTGAVLETFVPPSGRSRGLDYNFVDGNLIYAGETQYAYFLRIKEAPLECFLRYNTDFSTDPGWDTNNSNNFFRDPVTNTFYARTIEGADEYATMPIDWRGNSFKVEFDIKVISTGWASGITVGLFDSDRTDWLPSMATVAYMHSDSGRHLKLTARTPDFSGGCPPQVLNFNLNQWYHNEITWDKEAQTLALRITMNGQNLISCSIPGVNSFAGDMKNLGVAWVGHRASNNATVSYLDNFKFYECAKQCPVADAGPNIAISTEEQNSLTIQGTASDLDNDSLTCRWLEGTNELSPWQSAGANGECSLDLSQVSDFTSGEHTLKLEVSDGKCTSSDEMILTVNNSAPHPAPTGGGSYEIYTPVILGGQVSDFDGDLVSYEWWAGSNLLFSGQIQTVAGGTPVDLPGHVLSNFALGDHTLTLCARDGINPSVCKDIAVKIKDTTAPNIAPVPNLSILWPPNHKMVDIVIKANASDNSGGLVTLSATVFINEPEDGLGDGDASPDWTIPVIDQGNGIIYLQLRAERSGSGNGRIYTIAIVATDASGNYSQASVEIAVPHDQRKK